MFPVKLSESYKAALAVAFVMLSACTGPEEEVIKVEKPATPFVYDLTDIPVSAETDPLVSTGRASLPNVEVFPLEERPSLSERFKLKPPENEDSYAYLDDPSIEIYPLDGPVEEENSTLEDILQREALDEGKPLPLVSGQGEKTIMPPVEVGRKAEEFFKRTEEPVLRLHFAHDSTRLTASERDQIEELLDRLNFESKDVFLSIEGHASKESSLEDAQQRRIINMRVAALRAYSVARVLIQAGAPPGRIRLVSWGEAVPSDATHGKTAAAASRRVEIYEVP